MTHPGRPDHQNAPRHFGTPPRPATVKPGVAIGILIAVIALTAFCVTGFAAPGFLLGKGSGLLPPAPSSSPVPTSAPTSRTSTTTISRPTRPRVTVTRRPAPQPPEKGVQVITDFLAKIAVGDKAGAIALACEQQKRFMDDKIDSLLPPGSRVTITKTGGTSGFVLADVAGTVESRRAKGTVIADRRDDGDFCVTTFSIRDA
ncbi:hypothetical protein [Amycolatopsis sp. BJA-103]|uniref:hypothetical protein n=1 Tax=Amycolatopsis sp. BJA-103 TaxID=1911175 RepID=UPI000C79479D|nr:hypothetical protein [Amycolatopsis sp. BJA-103]AUI58195.1 hypothetical protein BKN51_08130 [Amycolatopsis sp. BJA-103]PNE13173.1 hypothetical protein B1H26_41695 [Amycolatopsis sp. BJA-103]